MSLAKILMMVATLSLTACAGVRFGQPECLPEETVVSSPFFPVGSGGVALMKNTIIPACEEHKSGKNTK